MVLEIRGHHTLPAATEEKPQDRAVTRFSWKIYGLWDIQRGHESGVDLRLQTLCRQVLSQMDLGFAHCASVEELDVR